MSVTSNARIDNVLRRMWMRVLKLDSVQDSDNFLDFGGNSLRAGDLVSQLQAELGIEVPIDVVLSEETFGSLLQYVVRELEEQRE